MMRSLWRRGRSEEPSRPERPTWPTFTRAVRLLWPYRFSLVAFLTAITFVSLVGLVTPLIIRRIIDVALPNGDKSELILLIVIMLAATVFGSLASVLQSFLSNVISQSVMFDLRAHLYRHLSGMSMGWFTANRSGETLSRINNDVGGIQGVVSDTLGAIVSNVITLVSTFVLMLLLDWRLAIFSMIFLPLFVIPSRRVGNIQRGLYRDTQEHFANMSSQMQETLSVSGALLMKTFGRQAEEESRFVETAGQIRTLSIRRAMTGRWFMMGVNLFGSIGTAVVFLYGGLRVIEGDMTLGTVFALSTLLPRLFTPAAQLLGINAQILSSLALFERIFDYMDLEQEITDRPGATPLTDVRGRIEFRHVGFSYQPGHPVLHGVSLEVEPGNFAALVGATGSGKTTIVNLLPRLYDVDSGQVLVDGRDVRDVTLESLQANIGLVNQEPFLFHASIRENLRYGRPDATDEEVESAARAANIHTFIASLSDGYDTLVGERGYRLSGGEKQRVAIARALLKDPAILILDEATSSVDTITERAIQNALENVTRGRTVLAIAHRLSTVLAADVIFVVGDGRIVESGSHSELLAQQGAYYALYEQQFDQRVGAFD